MKKRNLLTLAAALVAAVFVAPGIKADAAEIVHSDVYGDVAIVEEDNTKVMLFSKDSDAVMQFMKESAADPYFIRYNLMDAPIAKVKATASSAVIKDDDGNAVAYLGAAELQQEIVQHLTLLAAVDAMTPEQKAALENQQLVNLAGQQQMVLGLQQEMAVEYQKALAAGDQTSLELAQFGMTLIAQMQELVTAKQQALLLYQQQAAPEAIQPVLLKIQDTAGTIQKELADFSKQYGEAIAEVIRSAF